MQRLLAKKTTVYRPPAKQTGVVYRLTKSHAAKPKPDAASHPKLSNLQKQLMAPFLWDYDDIAPTKYDKKLGGQIIPYVFQVTKPVDGKVKDAPEQDFVNFIDRGLKKAMDTTKKWHDMDVALAVSAQGKTKLEYKDKFKYPLRKFLPEHVADFIAGKYQNVNIKNLKLEVQVLDRPQKTFIKVELFGEDKRENAKSQYRRTHRDFVAFEVPTEILQDVQAGNKMYLREDKQDGELFDKLKEYSDAFENFVMHQDSYIEGYKIVEIEAKRSEKPTFYDPKKVKLLAHGKTMASSHTIVRTKPDSASFLELISTNEGANLPQSCVLNLILDTFAGTETSRKHKMSELLPNKKEKETTEARNARLYKDLTGGDFKPEGPNPVNAFQIMKWLEKRGVGMQCTSVDGKLIPGLQLEKSEGCNIRPSVLRFVIHNQHAYACDDDSANRSDWVSSKLALPEPLPEYPRPQEGDIDDESDNENENLVENPSLKITSSHEPEAKPNLESIRLLNSLDELAKYDWKKMPSQVTFYTAIDLSETLKFLIEIANHEPTITWGANSIQGLTIRLEKSFVHLKAPQLDTQDNKHISEANEEEILGSYRLLKDLTHQISSALMTYENRSTYSPSLLYVLDNMKRLPLTKSFSDYSGTKKCITGIDLSKAYPHTMRSIKNIPVYTSFDDVQPYDNHTIEPYNFYVIQMTHEPQNNINLIFFQTSIMLTTGESILEMTEEEKTWFTIVAFSRPVHLPPNEYGRIAQETFENDELLLKPAPVQNEEGKYVQQKPIHMAKLINNIAIGKTGHHTNVKKRGMITLDEDEADMLVAQNPKCKKIPHLHNGVAALWYIVETNEKQCTNGWRPLHTFMMDKFLFTMWRAAQHLEKHQLKVACIKTDFLGVEIKDSYQKTVDILKSIQLNGKPMVVDHTSLETQWDTVGQWKLESNIRKGAQMNVVDMFETPEIFKKPPHRVVQLYHNQRYIDMKQAVIPPPSQTQIQRVDEWDDDEAEHLITTLRSISVTGQCAGAGKTRTFLRTLQKAGKRGLVIGPTNLLLLATKEKANCEVATIYGATGFQPFTGKINKLKASTRETLDNLDILVVDEVRMFSFHMLVLLAGLIQRLKEKNPNLIVGCTGDEGQLPPVNDREFQSCVNRGQYLNMILAKLFDYNMDLKINKRTKDGTKNGAPDADRDKFNALYRQGVEGKAEVTINQMLDLVPNKISHINQMPQKNLAAEDKVVTFTNKTLRYLNKEIHSKKPIPKKAATVEYNGQTYYTGMKLRQTSDFSGGIANNTYDVVAVDSKAGTLTLKCPLEQDEFELTVEQLKYFELPYALTCHCLQGATVTGRVYIFMDDLEKRKKKEDQEFAKQWLYTAVTRANQHKNVYIFQGKLDIPIDEIEQTKSIKNSIKTYKDQDEKRFHGTVKYQEEEYIDEEWVREQLEKCKMMCGKCGEAMTWITFSPKTWTIDRINNSLPHLKTNCRTMCKHCNTSSSNRC
jgi:hypothetical protein